MKMNGKEILGCGIIETALDGLSATEYCLCVTYKKERKNGKGFDVRRTTLPEIVRRNNDLALAIPEFIGENMREGIALETCAKFSDKFSVPMLPIEAKRLDELRAIVAATAAAKKADKAASAEGEGAEGAKEKKPKKTTAERIIDILEKATQERDIQAAFIVQVLERIAPNSAAQIEELLRYEFQKRTTPTVKEEEEDKSK